MNQKKIVLPLTIPLRILYFVLSYLIICVGIALSNRCKLPIIQTDLFPLEVADITGKPYARIKIGFDVICLLVTACMTCFFLGRILGLGVGTIVAGIYNGERALRSSETGSTVRSASYRFYSRNVWEQKKLKKVKKTRICFDKIKSERYTSVSKAKSAKEREIKSMTEQQYKRASKKVFLVVAIVYGYVVLTMLAYLGANKDASVGRAVLQLVISVAVIAFSAFANAAKGGTRQGAIMICTSLAAGYVVIMLVNSTSGTWAYALPMLLATFAYLDYRLMVGGNIVVIGANLLRLVIQLTLSDSTRTGRMCLRYLSSVWLPTLPSA